MAVDGLGSKMVLHLGNKKIQENQDTGAREATSFVWALEGTEGGLHPSNKQVDVRGQGLRDSG